jgi:hypothetical protein
MSNSNSTLSVHKKNEVTFKIIIWSITYDIPNHLKKKKKIKYEIPNINFK